MIEESSPDDLSKDIKNFEVNIKKEGQNPMDQLSSQSSASQEETTTATTASQTEKDENLMKNSDASKYNEQAKVLGGNEEKKVEPTPTTNTTTTTTPTTTPKTDVDKDYEEKTRIFHLNPEEIEASREKTTPDIANFYSILFIGVLCTLALLIIALRNFFQKYFELYILTTLRYILMY